MEKNQLKEENPYIKTVKEMLKREMKKKIRLMTKRKKGVRNKNTREQTKSDIANKSKIISKNILETEEETYGTNRVNSETKEEAFEINENEDGSDRSKIEESNERHRQKQKAKVEEISINSNKLLVEENYFLNLNPKKRQNQTKN